MPTVVSSTIGSGRDYSTLAAWEAAAPANLVTSDEVWEGLVYAEGGGTNGEWAISTTLTISGSTVDATRFKRLAAAAGSSFADAGSKVLRYDTAKGVAIRATGGYGNAIAITVSESRFEAEGLQLKANGASGALSIGSSLTGVKVKRCILDQGTRTANVLAVSSGGSGSYAENCVLITGSVASVSNPSYNNCTIFTDASSRTFITSSYGSAAVLTNCAVFGFTTLGTGVSSSSSYNATDFSSFTGSNNQTSLTASSQFQNTTYGSSLDLRTKTGAALLEGGTSTGAPAADIFGTSRPQGSLYDVGAHELAGGSTYPDSLTESATASDAATAAYIATASVAESITAADSLAAATTWVRSLTEAATVAEAITTAGTFTASITEAASTADALTSAVTWARALTEAASASDLATAIRHAVAALTEAATAGDSQATGSIYAGSLTESASVSDALTAAATLVALLTEVATASDAATSAATWVRLLTEPATAVDSVAGAQGATYTASVTEVLAAAELLVAVLAAQGVISAPPLGHGLGMSRRVTQAGRSRPANLNSRTR